MWNMQLAYNVYQGDNDWYLFLIVTVILEKSSNYFSNDKLSLFKFEFLILRNSTK